MLNNLIARYPELECVREDIEKVYETLVECYENGGKLLVCGNGGSAADAEHMVGELMKNFVKKRPMGEDMRKALIAVDPEKGLELAAKLQGV